MAVCLLLFVLFPHVVNANVGMYLCSTVCVFVLSIRPLTPGGFGASSSSDCDAITLLAYSGAALLL